MSGREEFDYIIVGGGSAGCVLAGRLSEDPGVRVLLLEAGGAEPPMAAVPAAFSSMFKSEVDWDDQTEPQKSLGRSVYWPAGKVLGGSSSINVMMYTRGNHADYDQWRDEFGAAGWGYSDVLPYFVKAESNSRLSGPLHGTDGPLHVEDPVYTHELSRAWVESAVSWGMRRNDDFNGESQFGAGLYQLTCHHGRRWSAADAYLRPALGRPNLTVRTDARVTRVVLSGGRATGVAVKYEGTESVIHAEREVILSSGAVGSPHLLMLSGIGPAAELRAHGIEPTVPLAGVGANLQDHVMVPLLWSTTGTTDLLDLATAANMDRWMNGQGGPFASNIGEAGGFLGGAAQPDIQIIAGPTGFFDNGLSRAPHPAFTANAAILAPNSRGRLTLRSADPSQRPSIDPGYLSDPKDLDTLLDGLHILAEIARQGPIARYLEKPFLPDSADLAALSTAELREHVRRYCQSVYHPVGTCAMGTSASSVVDTELKVHGIDNLRVVDASVMPVVLRGNTNAPTIMIAEKAADQIRGRI